MKLSTSPQYLHKSKMARGPRVIFVALISLAGLVNLVPSYHAQMVVTQTFDGFLDGRKPCTPDTFVSPCSTTNYVYSEVGSGSVAVETGISDGSGKALTISASGPNILFDAQPSNQCGPSISFALATSVSSVQFPEVAITTPGTFGFSGSNPSTSTTYVVVFTGTNHNHAFLQASLRTNGASGATYTTPDLIFAASNPVANQFYHFTVTCPASLATGGNAVLYSPEAAALGTSTTQVTVGANAGTSSALNTRIEFLSTAAQSYVDSLIFAGGAGAGVVIPTVDAAATTTNTMTLIGFDVDPMKRVVIARESSGGTSKIDTFDPDTLVLQGVSPLTNSCNKIDGVMAWNTQPSDTRGYAGFLDCTVSPTSSNFLKIRNPLLGDPDQAGTLCEGTSPNFCDFDLQTQTGGDVCPGATTNSLPGGSTAIGNIASAPISWTNGQTQTDVVNVDNVLIGFAFSDTSNGNIGLWAIQQNHNEPDESCGVSTAFGSPSATKQICTWRSDDGHDYMTAVSDSVSALTWRTDVDRTAKNIFAPNSFTQPNVVLTQVYPHQSPFNLNVGVACAGSYNYVLTSGGTVAAVKVLGSNLGMKWQISGAIATQRGIAVSRDNLRVAYTSDSTHVTIANATTGTILGTVVIPSGTFKEMRLDDAANNLYIATSTKISRYDLAGANAGINSGNPNGVRGSGGGQCTIDATGSCSTGTGTPTTSTTGTFFGLNPGAFDPSGQGDQTKGGFFLSLLLILGFAAVGAGLLPTTKVSGMIFGAGLGALLGFAWTVFLGVMPPIITFILVLIGSAGIGLKRLVASRSGSDA